MELPSPLPSDIWLALVKLQPIKAFFSFSITIQELFQCFNTHGHFKASLEFHENLDCGSNTICLTTVIRNYLGRCKGRWTRDCPIMFGRNARCGWWTKINWTKTVNCIHKQTGPVPIHTHIHTFTAVWLWIMHCYWRRMLYSRIRATAYVWTYNITRIYTNYK